MWITCALNVDNFLKRELSTILKVIHKVIHIVIHNLIPSRAKHKKNELSTYPHHLLLLLSFNYFNIDVWGLLKLWITFDFH